MVILIPSLAQLRTDFNFIAPNRKTASDGWIGDTAHQESTSDHNDDEIGNVPIHDADSIHEVHAVDVDSDLNQPGITMQKCINTILVTPKDLARLRYIIYNRQIWSASNNWKPETYTGSDPHTGHGHFSGSYTTSKEYDSSQWSIRELAMPLDSTDFSKIEDIVKNQLGSHPVMWALNYRLASVLAMSPQAQWQPGIYQDNALTKMLRTMDSKLDTIFAAIPTDSELVTDFVRLQEDIEKAITNAKTEEIAAVNAAINSIPDAVISRLPVDSGGEGLNAEQVRAAVEAELRERFNVAATS